MSTFVGIPRIPAAAPEREMPEADRRAVRMAVSLLLDYPGEDFLEKVGAVEAELAALLMGEGGAAVGQRVSEDGWLRTHGVSILAPALVGVPQV